MNEVENDTDEGRQGCSRVLNISSSVLAQSVHPDKDVEQRGTSLETLTACKNGGPRAQKSSHRRRRRRPSYFRRAVDVTRKLRRHTELRAVKTGTQTLKRNILVKNIAGAISPSSSSRRFQLRHNEVIVTTSGPSSLHHHRHALAPSTAPASYVHSLPERFPVWLH